MSNIASMDMTQEITNLNLDAGQAISCQSNSIFLVLPLPFWEKEGEILVESQAGHGLDRWAENFDRVIVAAPVDHRPDNPVSSWTWKPLTTLQHSQSIQFIPLPQAYNLQHFSRVYCETRKQLSSLIRESRYLQFAIGGLVGDWGAVSALEASKQQRKFAVWADRVEHQVIGRTETSFRSKLINLVRLPLMKQLERRVVKKCTIGLFNGNETFSYYQDFNTSSFKVHDIHTSESHYISPEDLKKKQQHIITGQPIRICYSGRADQMKAPLQWLEVIQHLDAAGINFTALWMGDGNLLPELKQGVQAAKLSSKVMLPGFIEQHDDAMKAMRESDIFLFTHITPESPRCLIESLISGTPIIGYGSAYSQDLIANDGGGELVPTGDSKALADTVIKLVNDRQKLSRLIEQAAKNGRRFNDIEAFRHRSHLIKEYQQK